MKILNFGSLNLDYDYQLDHFVQPEECARYTMEWEKKLCERMNASSFEAMIVCEVEGRIAGNCAITFAQGSSRGTRPVRSCLRTGQSFKYLMTKTLRKR